VNLKAVIVASEVENKFHQQQISPSII